MALPDGVLAGAQAGEISLRLARTSLGDSLYLVFPVGIEGFSIQYPTRAAVSQALDGFWLDSLGAAISTFTITGHTGYKPHNLPGSNNNDGRQEFYRLVKIYQEHQRRCVNNPNNRDNLLVYTDVGSQFMFYCFATDLRVTKQSSTSLLFHFEMDLTVVVDQSHFLATTLPGLPDTGGGGSR